MYELFTSAKIMGGNRVALGVNWLHVNGCRLYDPLPELVPVSLNVYCVVSGSLPSCPNMSVKIKVVDCMTLYQS